MEVNITEETPMARPSKSQQFQTLGYQGTFLLETIYRIYLLVLKQVEMPCLQWSAGFEYSSPWAPCSGRYSSPWAPCSGRYSSPWAPCSGR